MNKKKVLVLADSPTCNSGFGQVSKNILRTLYDTGKYDFDIVGINYNGNPYDEKKFPYNIYPAKAIMKSGPAYDDVFGRQVFLDLLMTGKYDLVWVLQDTFNIEPVAKKINEAKAMIDKKFEWIYYYPIDAQPKKEWIENAVMRADYPVAYSNYAKKQTLNVLPRSLRRRLEGVLRVIYHGTNVKDFYPFQWTKEERQKEKREVFGSNADKFIFMNLNRNQMRKDLFRGMLAAKKLSEEREDVYFYFHCDIKDRSGIDLEEIAKQIDFPMGEKWSHPQVEVMKVNRFTTGMINQLYNLVDGVFSTTLGEGWGLLATEAMATKKPVILPNNTTAPEILGENRGTISKTKQEFVQKGDNNRIRPLTDVDDLVKKMHQVIDNKKETQEKVENAYKWVQEYKWEGEKVGGEWKKLFEEATK